MANKTIKGLTVEIGGDTTKLGKALEDVEKKSRDLSSELGSINKLLKMDPKNTELLTQKQKNLKDAVSGTEERLKQLKEAQSQVAQGSSEWDNLQREIIETEQRLEGLIASRERGDTINFFTEEGFFWLPRKMFGIENHLYSFYD